MRSGRVSLIVIAAALIAAFAIPQCRRPILEMARPWWAQRPAAVAQPEARAPAEVPLDAVIGRLFPPTDAMAAAHPDDWQNHLAAADEGMIGAPHEEDEHYLHYRRASQLKPESPVPQLRLALALLRLVPLPDEQPDDAPLLSDEQRTKALHDAESALMAARRLDPDNAAAHYLLAYIALARDDSAAAQRRLQAGMRKPRWTLYRREVSLARLHVYQQANAPRFGAILYVYGSSSSYLISRPLRALAKRAAGRADRFRDLGNGSAAVFWYWAAFRMGDLQMTQAHDVIEALHGRANAAIATGSFLSDQERQAIAAKFPEAAQGYDPQQSQRRNAELWAASARNFEAYLRAHGHRDLAQYHAQAAAQMERIMEGITQHVGGPRLWSELFAAAVPLARSGLPAGAAGVVLGMLVVTGILWLILRPSERLIEPTRWSWRTWGVLFAIVFLPAIAALWAIPPGGPGQAWMWVVAAPAVVGGGPLLFVLLTLVVMIVRRRRAGGEAIGGFRDFMHSLAVLLPPTLAVLLVIGVATLPAADRALERFARQQVQNIEQGEMVYYGIHK